MAAFKATYISDLEHIITASSHTTLTHQSTHLMCAPQQTLAVRAQFGDLGLTCGWPRRVQGIL